MSSGTPSDRQEGSQEGSQEDRQEDSQEDRQEDSQEDRQMKVACSPSHCAAFRFPAL